MREHSAIILDGIQTASLNRCPHCGGHFVVSMRGTLEDARSSLGDIAKPRVYCRKCDRLTCGRLCCDPAIIGCVPVEARLDHAEGKVTPYTPAIGDMEENGILVL